MSDTTLYLGNCAKVMRDFGDACIDLTVTSPPYDNLRTYNGYEFDFPAIAAQLWRVTKPGGVVVWVVGDATINGSETGTSFRQALEFMRLGFNLHDTMIWNKGSYSAVGSLQIRYAPVFEFMFVFSKESPKTFIPIMDRKNKNTGNIIHGTVRSADGSMKQVSGAGRKITTEYGQRFNIWEIDPVKDNRADDHPAPFPEALARDHILSWSNPGDTVLDPMMGSGTTIKMARIYNRNAIGIEISEEYYKIAEQRTAQMVMEL